LVENVEFYGQFKLLFISLSSDKSFTGFICINYTLI